MNNKRKIIENDVIEANKGILFNLCSQYGKKLEHEDRISAAYLGLLYAIRSYCKGIFEFSAYETMCIRNALCYEEDNQRKARRIEHPLSLDMQVKSCDSTQRYVDFFTHPESDFTSNVIVSDFLSKLNKKERKVVYMCISGNSLTEIEESIGVSEEDIDQLKKDIYHKWNEYDKL